MKLASYDMFRSPSQFQKHIKIITHILTATFKAICPKDQWTLAEGIYPLITIRRDNKISISIVVGENVKYAGATQERWDVRPGKNPNEGWMWVASNAAAQIIASFISDPETTIDSLDEDIKEEIEEDIIEKIEVVDE